MKKIHPQSKYSRSRHSSLLIRSLFLAFFIFNFSFFICYAADFGLLLGQHAEMNTEGGEEAAPSPGGFEYQASLLPHFSMLFGDSSELYVSAGFSLNVEDTVYFVPELLRTEYSYHSGNWRIRVGRIPYADPLGFIATGLFDGARFTYNTKMGNLGIGAWYTGLLYKKSANITMTAEDQISWNTPLDYDDFSNTYFASRRFLASLDWEHPSVAELLNLKAAVTIQADLSGRDEKYHSQYFTVKAAMPFKSFGFELGGSLETAQSKQAPNGADTSDDNDFNAAFAWDLGVFWTLPTKFDSRLSLTGLFAGGNTGGKVAAFVPITGHLYGDIIQAKLSGISVLSLDYTARFIESLETSLGTSYFVRNDLGTFMAWPINYADNTGYFLGPELFLRLDWNPVSDIQLSLGGGVFLPGMGNVNPDEKPKWHAELTAVITIY
jgi:hypothetical protein